MMEGRSNDHTPVRWHDCKWEGLVMECIHTYKGVPMSTDVEPVDQCPRCGNENVYPIDEELVPV